MYNIENITQKKERTRKCTSTLPRPFLSDVKQTAPVLPCSALFTFDKWGKITLRVSQIRLYGVALSRYALPCRVGALSGWYTAVFLFFWFASHGMFYHSGKSDANAVFRQRHAPAGVPAVRPNSAISLC